MLGFIVNGFAGRGRGKKVWAIVERSVRERGIPYHVYFTEYSGHAVKLSEQLSNTAGVEAVIAVGGDGTVNETAAGLIGTIIPLGYIPAGSGNDFARALNLPIKPEGALERILERRLRTIDVGTAGGRYFVSSFGAGFDGEVAKASNASVSKGWMNAIGLGALSYIVTVLSTLRSYEPIDITLEVDGRRMMFHKVWMVVAANSPYYGGGMMICPDAANDDGMFHFCVVHGVSRLQLLRYFPRIYKGSHIALPYVTMLEGSNSTISSRRSIICHYDGEPAKAEVDRIQISLIRNGLTVIA